MKYNQLVPSTLIEMIELSHISIDGAAEMLQEHNSAFPKLQNGKMNVNEEHLKACSELLKMPVTSFLPEETAVVQFSNGEWYNRIQL